MKYETRKRLAEQHARKVKETEQLKKIYHKNDKPKKPWTFTKSLMAFIIANCTLIEIYALVIMWRTFDLSALPTLITTVVGECIITLGYMAKSTVENKVGGITYDSVMEEVRSRIHLSSEMSEKEKKEAVG